MMSVFQVNRVQRSLEGDLLHGWLRESERVFVDRERERERREKSYRYRNECRRWMDLAGSEWIACRFGIGE
jgi:hypothetical protein